MLTITASDLARWDSCRRKFLLNHHWRVVRWEPKLLFDACLREGVTAISNGAEPAAAISTARTRFLSAAANPGLEMTRTWDPWTVANDWAGMLATTLTAISRLSLLVVHPATKVALPQLDVTWQVSAWADDSGTLHRWVTVDSWDQDRLAVECHRWPVIGDMVMADTPLTIHAVEIGTQRNGRRHSPWAKCYKHPCIAGVWRFQRPDGEGGWRPLEGKQWKSMWYADQTKPEPTQWCDLMDHDGVMPRLLHHSPIAQPSAKTATRIRAEIFQVAREIETALREHPRPEGGMELPMTRTACDPVTGPCPYQSACYRERPEHDIGGLGLYQLRAAPASGRSSPQPSPRHDTVVVA